MRGVLHRIEFDIGGNLGIAWQVPFCRWGLKLFERRLLAEVRMDEFSR